MGQTKKESSGEGQGGGAPRGRAGVDILGAKLITLDWTDRRKAIEAVLSEVLAKASSSERWYLAKKVNKIRGAVFLRFTAIVAGILSGLWPVLFSALAAIFPVGQREGPSTFDFKLLIPLTAVFVVVAAGCVSLDAFFGFSSGWIRYVAAYQSLQTLREGFELSWAKIAIRFPPKGDIPDEIMNGAIDALVAFTKAVNDTVRDETQQWAADFREALKNIGDTLEKQRLASVEFAKLPERGAVTVRVAEIDKLDGHVWTLTVSGQIPVQVAGVSAEIIERVAPGLVAVRASAKRDGKLVSAVAVVTVEPAKAASVDLTLA